MDDGRAKRLQARARSLLGPGVAVSYCLIGRADGQLLAAEERAMARAVPARRAEFAAGRQAARAAMAALGHDGAAIPMGADRAPVWPAGLTGSITHAGGLALAAIAPVGASQGLGLDLEGDTPMAEDLWPTILRPDERDWLATQPAHHRQHLAKRMFSAKEACYKAQYARSNTLLDFHDISIAYTDSSTAFSAHFHRTIPGFAQGTILHGQQESTGAMILSTLRI